MSLGREIKEAIGAFGAVSRIDDERRRTNAYEEIARNKGNSTGLPGQSVLDEAYKRKYGTLPPGAKSGGFFSRVGNALGMGGGSSSSGGAGGDGMIYQMPVDPNAGTLPAEPAYDPDDANAGYDEVQGAEGGGVILRQRQREWMNANTGAVRPRAAPPEVEIPAVGPGDPPEVEIPAVGPGDPPEVEIPAVQDVAPGAPAATDAVRDRDAVPYEGVPRFGDTSAATARGAVPSRAEPAPVVAPGGNSAGGKKRKALRDQTRTEAYDPVLDKDDPDNMIRLAINGAMDYANETFHLKGDKVDAIGTVDPNTDKGRQAFIKGTGAAPQEDIDQLNRIAAETAPDKKLLASDPNVRDSIIALRRLNIVYEHFVQTGQTDKANKAAFEIIQYSAAKASEYGTQAKQAIDAGDVEGAKKLVARAYSQVPDGNHMVISPDGRFAIVRDDGGKTVDQFTITPQNLLQAALGLSNKSMFWEVLSNRANSVGKNKAKEPTELQKVQIENLKARTEVVRKKLAGGGGAAAAPAPSPVAGILQELQSRTGVATPNPNQGGEGSQPASPQAAAADPVDGDPDVQAMEGTNPVDQGGGDVQLPPNSLLRITKPTARQSSGTPGDTPAAVASPDSVLRVNRSNAPTAGLTHDGLPARQNADGTHSTEVSITVTNPKLNEGRPTNIPSLWGGKEVSEDEAVERALATGKPYQSFPSIDEAVAAARQRSAAGGASAPVTPEGKPAPAAKFDPDGAGYDMESAKAAGLKAEPDPETGEPHWPSRDPKSGLLLKGRGHETWAKTVEGERKAGYQIFKGNDGHYYSIMDNTVVPNDVIHDGKRTNAPVFQPPKYDVAHPGAKLEGTKFAGANPYSKVLQDEGFRQWVAANTKNKAGPQELARVQNMEREYNNQIKAWETGRKAFEKEHRDAFNKEQALNVAEVKRVYDRTLTTRELQELPAQINEYVKPIAEGKGPDGKVRPSIWNAPPEVVQSEELKSLATNLFTSNKNMPTDMAVRLVHALTVPGTEPNERQFQPRGYDRAGNIVVNPKIERKDPKTGKIVSEVDDSVEFHIRPGAFEQINRITERYRPHLLKEQAQAQAKPKESTWGDVGNDAWEIAKKIPNYATNYAFTDQYKDGKGYYSDVGRALTYPSRKIVPGIIESIKRNYKSDEDPRSMDYMNSP